jgi:hypothetical protein
VQIGIGVAEHSAQDDPAKPSPWSLGAICPSSDTPYPPARLTRLIGYLARLGVAVKADDEGEQLARVLGAEALYIPEAGEPGILILSKRPTCGAVIEELLHIAQHRLANWREISDTIPRLEVEAHDRLIVRARRWGWPPADIDRLMRVREYWRRR